MILTRTRYNARGEAFETVDPKGIVQRTEFDDAGRTVRTIQNYVPAGSPGADAPDANLTVEMTYNADGRQATLTAVNPATGNQTTRYLYGVSPATGSKVTRNDLLRETIYPDGGLDTVRYRYNRQGERIGMTDQNGTVHSYERDKLGRSMADLVTSLGTGVDGAVREIETSYEVRGLVEKITSRDSAGAVVNEVQNEYNGLGQLTKQFQSHAGAVTSGTPFVEYTYDHSASGGVFTKGARPTGITYPSGREIDFDYGSVGGAGDKLARIEALVDGAQTLVAYAYLGLGTFVVTDYIEPQVKLDYSAVGSGDAKYPGFDQYNRVVQHHWIAYGASPGLRDGFDYGYDANSNRLWRANLTAPALDQPFDELYRYDRLNRLVDFQRGTLNAEHTAILGTPTKEQTWSLDATGNWSHFTSAAEGDLEPDQTRLHNPANEITEISSWFPPGYDHAGNMTRIPKPAAPQEGFLATWDAWNRLVRLHEADPCGGAGNLVQENAYDGQFWRTVRKDYEAGELSESRHFFYTGEWQAIEERLGAVTTPERQYIWGLRYIDDLVLRDRDTDNDDDIDERLYAMQDVQFNICAVTDDSSATTERYAYSPYGVLTVLDPTFHVRDASDFAWTVSFTSRSIDPATSLLEFRNRIYHAPLGCFVSRDPANWAEWSSSSRYADNNPVRFVDPAGLCTAVVDAANSTPPGALAFTAPGRPTDLRQGAAFASMFPLANVGLILTTDTFLHSLPQPGVGRISLRAFATVTAMWSCRCVMNTCQAGIDAIVAFGMTSRLVGNAHDVPQGPTWRMEFPFQGNIQRQFTVAMTATAPPPNARFFVRAEIRDFTISAANDTITVTASLVSQGQSRMHAAGPPQLSNFPIRWRVRCINLNC